MIPAWLAGYRDEVLRWNASINLVSRRDPAERLAVLVGQCLDAGERLLAAPEPLGFAATGSVAYLDLGSGAGLPGIAWHGLLVRAGARPRTWLVEPRAKRAWFLERVARGAEPAPRVLAGRWGEVAPGRAPDAARILVSLKALRLTDTEVLGGLAPFLGPGAAELVIARFHPARQAEDDALRRDLALPDPGVRRDVGARAAVAAAAGVLRPEAAARAEAASLVVSRYRLTTP